jgi:hypothetical protein
MSANKSMKAAVFEKGTIALGAIRLYAGFRHVMGGRSPSFLHLIRRFIHAIYRALAP